MNVIRKLNVIGVHYVASKLPVNMTVSYIMTIGSIILNFDGNKIL